MNKQFGDRLKELRTKKSLTQEELAKLFNTGKSSISNYENNSRLPDAVTICKYADFFGVTVDYILGRSDIRNPEARSKDLYSLDVSGLPEEAIQRVEEYVELFRLKYDPDKTLKK